MGRRMGSTGWVTWPSLPSERWHDTGEGGMWVMAYYLASPGRDDFVRCCGPKGTIALPLPDREISPAASRVYRDIEGTAALPWGMDRTEAVYDAGWPVLAAFCVGTSGTSLADANGDYFDASFEDLTLRGANVLTALSQLYGRSPVLVTYLDT